MLGSQEYYLLLVYDRPMTNGYFSNKRIVKEGDLISLDDITTQFANAQELGDFVDKTATFSRRYSNATIISKREYNKIVNGEQNDPKKVEPVLFSNYRNLIYELFESGVNPDNYIDRLVVEYKDYLWNHKKEISTSLVRYVKLPGVTLDTGISYRDLDKCMYAYYYKKGTSYKKVRDTYIELCKFYPSRLRQNEGSYRRKR